MATETLLTTTEVRELLAASGIDVSNRTVQRRAESGELPYVRKLPTGGDYLFDRAVVEMYIRHRKKVA